MSNQNVVNESVARKVLETVDAGLVSGLGQPNPGQMCVEAAVCTDRVDVISALDSAIKAMSMFNLGTDDMKTVRASISESMVRGKS